MIFEQLLTSVVGSSPFAALTVYLVWQLRKDYRGVCDRLNKVEDDNKTMMQDQLIATTKALNKKHACSRRKQESD